MVKSTKDHLFEAASIGVVSAEALSEEQVAAVMGKTSRGVFLKSVGGWVLFISTERYRGPLTITLAGALSPSDDVLGGISPGELAFITRGKISFPESGLVISTDAGQVWRGPLCSTASFPEPERRLRLLSILKEVIKRAFISERVAELEPLLAWLPALPALKMVSARASQYRIDRLQSYLRERDMVGLAEALSDFLGIGAGLTPAGDDYVLGIVLALNRCNGILMPGVGLQTLNDRVMQAAYEKTTTLSASLITCATRGLADERLINLLDWVMCGTSHEPAPIDELLGWGASSGIATLFGYVAVLSA